MALHLNLFRGAMLSLLLAAPFGAHATETAVLDVTKIVAIGGSLTEIIFALGEQDRLVARDSTSLYPEDAMALPDVGYMRQLSPESVLSVNPSVVLALHGSGPKEAVDVLKEAGVTFIEIPERFDHDGILEKIQAVGKAIGVENKAAVLAATVDAKLKAAEAQTVSIKDRKRVLFVLSMQGDKILAAGGNTAADGIIRLAGAVNAMEGFAGYKQLSDEAVLAANPDVILMMDRRGGPSSGDPLANPAIAATTAGEMKALIQMDGSYLLGFGPRTADAIHDLAVSIYGQQVSD